MRDTECPQKGRSAWLRITSHRLARSWSPAWARDRESGWLARRPEWEKSDTLKGGACEAFDSGRGFFTIMGLDRHPRQFPHRTVLDQAGDESGMHGVAGSLGHHVAFNPAACKGEIADQIQNLMADVLVVEAQRAVLRPGLAENDGIFGTRSADQPHVP